MSIPSRSTLLRETATGRGTFYNSREEQAAAVEAAHDTQARRPIATALALRDLLSATADDAVAITSDGRAIDSYELVEPSFIQNVHHYRDEYLKDSRAPTDHVALFDEAQRAWDLQQTSKFMRQKRNQPNFNQSEPEFLISCIDRHEDWGVIVCLVGGGQEINTGEAGIAEWVEALSVTSMSSNRRRPDLLGRKPEP